MDAGKYDKLILFMRDGEDTDDGYTTIPGEPTEYARAWARVRYGSGQERREAAQEAASQAATFECDWNPTLGDVLMTDKITFDGASWDITSRAPLSNNREIHFTAVRKS